MSEPPSPARGAAATPERAGVETPSAVTGQARPATPAAERTPAVVPAVATTADFEVAVTPEGRLVVRARRAVTRRVLAAAVLMLGVALYASVRAVMLALETEARVGALPEAVGPYLRPDPRTQFWVTLGLYFGYALAWGLLGLGLLAQRPTARLGALVFAGLHVLLLLERLAYAQSVVPVLPDVAVGAAVVALLAGGGVGRYLAYAAELRRAGFRPREVFGAGVDGLPAPGVARPAEPCRTGDTPAPRAKDEDV